MANKLESTTMAVKACEIRASNFEITLDGDVSETEKACVLQYNTSLCIARSLLQQQIKCLLLNLHAQQNLSIEKLTRGPGLLDLTTKEQN